MNWQFLTMTAAPPPLDADAIHVWSVPLDQPCDESLLTPDEAVRASRFKMERVRRQFVAARVQLRQVLAGYLRIEPREVRIAIEINGKPVLDPSQAAGLHFNVSHSETLALFSVTMVGPTGIDLEHRRVVPDAEALVERFFTARERAQFQTLPQADRFDAFFHAWTRKEAVLKAIGRGVQSLDQCDITFGPGEPEAVLRVEDDHDTRSKWVLRSWRPNEEFDAAVAVRLPV